MSLNIPPPLHKKPQQEQAYEPPVDALLSYIEGHQAKPRADADPSTAARSSKAEKRARKKEVERLQKVAADSLLDRQSNSAVDDTPLPSSQSKPAGNGPSPPTHQSKQAANKPSPSNQPKPAANGPSPSNDKAAGKGKAAGGKGTTTTTNTHAPKPATANEKTKKKSKDGKSAHSLEDIFVPRDGPIDQTDADYDKEVEEFKRFCAAAPVTVTERKRISVNLNFSAGLKSKM